MTPILANAGIPMLAIQLPAFVCVFVPVVLIEARALQRKTPLPWRRSFAVSTAANLFSTLVGVPLTWLTLVGLQFLVYLGADQLGDSGPAEWVLLSFSIPWLAPSEGPGFFWMIAGAGLALCIPYYLVTVYSETWLIGRMEPTLSRSAVLKTQRRSHLATYALMYLAFLAGTWLMIF